MREENDEDVDAIADTIRSYLREHPNAADTLHGITCWWFTGNADSTWLANVERAVDRLVERGEMLRQTQGDGTVIFERNKEHD